MSSYSSNYSSDNDVDSDNTDPDVNITRAIACMPKVKSNTPRARFDIHFHSRYIRLFQFDVKKNVSNRHTIDKNDVIEMFRLPIDNQQIFFVFHLSHAIVGGNKKYTKYHFVVLNFLKNEDIEIELNDCDEIEDTFRTEIADDGIISGKTIDVFEKMVKHIFDKPVICPTVDGRDKSPVPALKCTFWDNDDHYLFPLDDCFITVWKYCQRLRLDEVQNVKLIKGEGRSRTFDFYIYPKLKQKIRRYDIGAAASKFLNCWYLEFKAIDQKHYEWLYKYCERHQIPIDFMDFKDQASCSSSNSDDSSYSDNELDRSDRINLKDLLSKDELEIPDPYIARLKSETPSIDESEYSSEENQDSSEPSSDQKTDDDDEEIPSESNQPTSASGSQVSNKSSVVGKYRSTKKRVMVISDESSSDTSVKSTPRKRRSVPQIEADDEC